MRPVTGSTKLPEQPSVLERRSIQVRGIERSFAVARGAPPSAVRHTYSSARRSSSRRSQLARVLAQQPSEAWPAAHGCGRDDRIRPGNRRSEVQAPMWSGLVVMLHPLPHHPLQVSTADDQDPVQALSATGTDLPLDVSVRLRCRDRSLDHPAWPLRTVSILVAAAPRHKRAYQTESGQSCVLITGRTLGTRQGSTIRQEGHYAGLDV